MTRWLTWALIVVAFIGFADAAYLTAEHYLGGIPTCFITTGCDTVLGSRFATIGPIPVALLGALYYLVMFLFATSLSDRTNVKHLKYLVLLSSLGFFTTIALMYIQVAVLKALCIYCIVSAVTTTLLFVGSLGLWKATTRRV